MPHSTSQRLSVGVLSLLLFNSCGGNKSSQSSSPSPRFDDIGVSVSELPLLAAGCTINAMGMVVTVKDGESAYLSLRPSDNVVTVNGNVFAPGGSAGAGGGGAGTGGGAGAGGALADTGRPCEIASNSSITIQPDTNGAKLLGRSVILDYVNGLFMKATSASTPSVKIDFTLSGDNGSKNSLKVRGSDLNDHFAIGLGSTTGAALNINAVFPALSGSGGSGGSGGAGGGGGAGGAGAGVVNDAFADVVFKNVATVIISSGLGDDRLDASGASMAGVGTAFPNGVSLFGNDGNDVITGGLGNDTLVGGIGNDVLNGCQGNDTYDMGAVPSGNDVIAMACTMNAEGTDTLDYGKRTGNLTVNLSRTVATASNPAADTGGNSGETGETAHISDRIVNVILGAGDDAITIPTGSTVIHKIKGGKGDDTFTGNGAQDTFDGELGDDTCVSANSIMDYSARTAAVTVSLCASTCNTNTDQTDGDPSATGSSHSGTGATTATTGSIDISTLSAGSGFTNASVGRTLTLTNCGTSANNASYTIVQFVSATSVKIDTTANSGFAQETAGCDFSEALPGSLTNTGTGALLTADAATAGSVTGLNHTTYMLGHKLQLTHTAASAVGGGTTNADDDGTYYVVKVLSSTSVAIDSANPTAGGTAWAGGVTLLDWIETGNEHDNIQCAHVIGGSADDTITGDTRNNILRGGGGGDTLQGANGNDQLFGEAGADFLYGGAGDDTLIGSDGIDNLIGGDGNDVLEGDAANDVFTCDGKNLSTSAANGTVPGDSDFKVDFATGDTLGASPTDCEF